MAVIHLMELSLFADPQFHFQFRLSILWNLFQTKFRVLSSPLWQYCTQMSNYRQIGKLNLRTSMTDLQQYLVIQKSAMIYQL